MELIGMERNHICCDLKRDAITLGKEFDLNYNSVGGPKKVWGSRVIKGMAL